MEPHEDDDSFETRLQSLPLRQPSPSFGLPATLQAMIHRAAPPVTLSQRPKLMKPKFKFAALAAIAASVVAIVVAFGGSSRESLAFAQVAEKLRAAQTLSFDSALTSQADGKVLTRNRNYYMAPGKMRTEMDADDGESGFVVFDTVGGKVLMADAKRKLARVSPMVGGGDGDRVATTIKELQNISVADARPLGEKTIDGIASKGFQIERGTDVKTIWADAATGAPVRIEILVKGFPAGPVIDTLTNFKFDVPLDPQLFSVEPPAGYTSQPFLPIDLNASPADLTAKFLKIYADQMDGRFPARLEDAIKELGEKLKPKDPQAPPSEELAQLAFYGAGMAVAIIHGRQGETWQYYPGHKLGEEDEMVFWFFNKKLNAHQAVYGDLRVEQVAKEDLPSVQD